MRTRFLFNSPIWPNLFQRNFDMLGYFFFIIVDLKVDKYCQTPPKPNTGSTWPFYGPIAVYKQLVAQCNDGYIQGRLELPIAKCTLLSDRVEWIYNRGACEGLLK